MNAKGRDLQGPIDLESTAELPVLDEFSSYDGGVYGEPALAAYADTIASTDSTDRWELPPATAPAPVPKRPSGPQLEDELRTLGASLLELQKRLADRGERLGVLEAELASAQAARKVTAEHAGALQVELTGARTAVSLYEARIKELEEIIRGRDGQLRAAAEREVVLQAGLTHKDQEIQTALALRDVQAQAEVSRQQSAAVRLRQDLEETRSHSAATLEALQSLEGRRGIFDAQLRELDERLQAREQTMGQLAAKADHGATQAGTLQLELESRMLRIRSLEAELTRLSASLGASTDEAGMAARENIQLRETIRNLTEQGAGQAAQVARLEAEAAVRTQEHAAQLRRHEEDAAARLQAQHAGTQAELEQLRARSLEQVAAVEQVTAQHAQRLAQISAFEARERELAAQIQSRDQAIEELSHAKADLTARLQDAGKWLEERDSLMQRLETEAVHSRVLVDNIQRSIRQLAPGPGATGPHEVVKDVGARMLVRVENGQEVVQVLGRRTTIGRTSDNDMQIDASYISRHHATIMTSATQTLIEDLGSTNGVHVNGRRVTRQLLKDGDTVIVGKLPFRFVVKPADAAGRP